MAAAMKDRVRASWRETVLVCAKCSKKVGGGFGDGGKTPLAKALRRELGLKQGRKATAGVVEVKCLDVCPKGAVVAVNAAAPGDWRLVRPGEDVRAVARKLGLGGDQAA